MFSFKKKGHKTTQAAALSFWNVATTCETCGEPIYRAMFRILHGDGVASFFAVESLGSTYQLVFNFRGTYIVLASGPEDAMLQDFHAIADDIRASLTNHPSPLPVSDAQPSSPRHLGIFRFSGSRKLSAIPSFWNIVAIRKTYGEPIYRAAFRVLHADGVTSFFFVKSLGNTYQLVLNFRGTPIVLESGPEDVMLQDFHAIVDDICSSSANHRSPIPASDAKPFSSSRFGIFRFSGRQKLGILLIAVVSALMGYPIIAARAAPTRPPAEP